MDKKIKRRIRHTTSSFIRASKELHNNKYDYSLVEFTGSHRKVKIGCLKHGTFTQRAICHLKGDGCRRCGRDKANRIHAITRLEFAERAIKVHGNRYDYSKVSYVNSATKIVIICPDHGEFEQNPHNHLHRKGCPRCKVSKGESFIYDILNKNGITFKTQYRLPEIKEIFFYDFYLPDHNLLIEFHGIQHYKFSKHFHRTKEKFLKQIVTDTKKQGLAKAWKYNFLCLRHDILDLLNIDEFETLLLKYVNRTARRN